MLDRFWWNFDRTILMKIMAFDWLLMGIRWIWQRIPIPRTKICRSRPSDPSPDRSTTTTGHLSQNENISVTCTSGIDRGSIGDQNSINIQSNYNKNSINISKSIRNQKQIYHQSSKSIRMRYGCPIGPSCSSRRPCFLNICLCIPDRPHLAAVC